MILILITLKTGGTKIWWHELVLKTEFNYYFNTLTKVVKYHLEADNRRMIKIFHSTNQSLYKKKNCAKSFNHYQTKFDTYDVGKSLIFPTA